MIDDIKDPAAGAQGMPMSAEEKSPVVEAKPKKKRGPGRPRKADETRAELDDIQRRLKDLEVRVNASVPATHTCAMCHGGGAKRQRGNTGEWFHEPCLERYRRGESPDPLPA